MFKLITTSFQDRLLRIAITCIFLTGFASASVVPFMSVIGIERLAFSEFDYALIQIIGAILSVFASVYVGIYTDQTGQYKPVLICSILAFTSATTIMYFAHSQGAFLIYMLVLMPIASTAFSQYFALSHLAANKNKALNKDFSSSITRAAFTLSWALTPPVWAIFIARGTDIYTTFGVAALVSTGILIFVLTSWPQEAKPAKKETPEPSSINGSFNASFNGFFKTSFFRGLRELGDTPIFIRVMLISVLISISNLSATLLGLLMLNNLGGTEADIGWFVGGVALAEIPTMLMGAIFLRYVSKSALLLIAGIINGGFLFGMGSATSVDQIWILIIPGGLSAGVILSVTIGYIQDLKPDNPGLGGSLVSVSFFSSKLYAATIFAAGTAFSDYAGTMSLGAAIGVIATLILFAMDRKPISTAPQQPPIETTKMPTNLNRIMIIGQPGSGKSTLARDLGLVTGLPVVHIDHIHWAAGWVERSAAEKARLCGEVHRRDQWIFEGGHSKTWPERLSRADVLIVLDIPLCVRAWRVFWRTIKYHGKTRPDLPENCPERFNWEFTMWIWNTRHTARQKMLGVLAGAPDDKVVYHLTSPEDVADFLTRFQSDLDQTKAK